MTGGCSRPGIRYSRLPSNLDDEIIYDDVGKNRHMFSSGTFPMGLTKSPTSSNEANFSFNGATIKRSGNFPKSTEVEHEPVFSYGSAFDYDDTYSSSDLKSTAPKQHKHKHSSRFKPLHTFDSIFRYNMRAKSPTFVSKNKSLISDGSGLASFSNGFVNQILSMIGLSSNSKSTEEEYYDDFANNLEESSKCLDMNNNQEQIFLNVTSYILTFISYLFFLLTCPISYWFIVKRLETSERMVIFRLGKMRVRGPGRFVVFPWIDRCKKVDTKTSAFSVPPQQFITVDGGIVETGADVQFTIVNVALMTSQVADHQTILRSLGKTLLIRCLVKKTVSQIKKDRKLSESDILEQFNYQVHKWGISVQTVYLSESKIIKEAENSSSSASGAVNSILKGLGMKSDVEYPTPREFINGATEGETTATGAYPMQPSVSILDDKPGGITLTKLGSGEEIVGKSKTTQFIGSGDGGGLLVSKPNENVNNSMPFNWGTCLNSILFNDPLVSISTPECYGVYHLEIISDRHTTSSPPPNECYFIIFSQDRNEIYTGSDLKLENADVSITVKSSDLGSILDQSMSPLNAYLTGRIRVNRGDVRKLKFLDKLTKRGHDMGSMFNV